MTQLERDLEFLNTLQIMLGIVMIGCALLIPFAVVKAMHAHREWKKLHNEIYGTQKRRHHEQ